MFGALTDDKWYGAEKLMQLLAAHAPGVDTSAEACGASDTTQGRGEDAPDSTGRRLLDAVKQAEPQQAEPLQVEPPAGVSFSIKNRLSKPPPALTSPLKQTLA